MIAKQSCRFWVRIIKLQLNLMFHDHLKIGAETNNRTEGLCISCLYLVIPCVYNQLSLAGRRTVSCLLEYFCSLAGRKLPYQAEDHGRLAHHETLHHNRMSTNGSFFSL